jgi:tRNA 2-thiocytidine biosynthesis protein TtcA
VIRPLAYVLEEEARAYAKASDLPVIGCCCPACGDLSLQRQRVKRMLMELEREHPGVKASLLKALGNVAPRHLLDRRLNPPDAPLRRGDDVPATTIADLDPDVASRLLPLLDSVS